MDAPRSKKIPDQPAAYAKAEHYCAYQERSQQEVRDKLYEWELKPAEVEDIISRLIENNYLNEERFAKAYVQGKFNQKGWGRIKIKQGLKLKRVPDGQKSSYARRKESFKAPLQAAAICHWARF